MDKYYIFDFFYLLTLKYNYFRNSLLSYNILEKNKIIYLFIYLFDMYYFNWVY